MMAAAAAGKVAFASDNEAALTTLSQGLSGSNA